LNIIVCLKRVPQTADAEVRVDSSGKDIEREHLTFDINEYDAYALEEAVLFKEKHGGEVTAVSVGPPDSQDTLRVALAKGADHAIRVKAEDFGELDPHSTSQLLSNVIKDNGFDIVFCGSIATDDGYSQVGVILAEMLGVPHAALVTKIDAGEGKADVHRELEGGLLEHIEMSLPAVITIQSGINTPRYASLIAIRKAAKKEITAVGADRFDQGQLVHNSRIEELFIPPVTKHAEMLSGDPDEVSGKLAALIKDKGLI
jgi:electron transfer flavoprotein beta subunit